MIVYQTIFLISCTAFVLTSSAVSKTRAYASSEDTRHSNAVKKLFNDTDGSSSTTISPISIEKSPKNVIAIPLIGEGGPISLSDVSESFIAPNKSISKNVEESKSKDENSAKSNDSDFKPPKVRNASVVARKGAVPSPKITARKGVGPEAPALESSVEGVDEGTLAYSLSPSLSSEKLLNSQKKLPSSTEKLLISADKLPVSADKAKDLAKVVTEKSPVSIETKQLEGNPSSSTKSGDKVENASEKSSTESMKSTSTQAPKASSPSTPTTKRFKPKPTVTIGEMDIDKPIPASPTKTPPLGMPRKIDYIVPVIITIMALPLLIGATFFLYRRGRDCWDKRHYRRMDFLIDGMYNDHSWK